MGEAKQLFEPDICPANKSNISGAGELLEVKAQGLGNMLTECQDAELRNFLNQLHQHLFVQTSVRALEEVSAYMESIPGIMQYVEKHSLSDIRLLQGMGFSVEVRESESTGPVSVRYVKVIIEGDDEWVEVDPETGPVWDDYKRIAEGIGYTGSSNCHRWGHKPWPEMSSTEREVWLIIIAKH